MSGPNKARYALDTQKNYQLLIKVDEAGNKVVESAPRFRGCLLANAADVKRIQLLSGQCKHHMEKTPIIRNSIVLIVPNFTSVPTFTAIITCDTSIAIFIFQLPAQDSATEWAKSTMSKSCIRINNNPPIIPNHIQVIPKLPSGIKKAPIIPPIINRNFRPQNLKYSKKCCAKSLNTLTQMAYPFCIPARPSLDDFTPIIIKANRAKKHVNIKQILYTARYPTALSQSTDIDNTLPATLELFAQNGTCKNQSTIHVGKPNICKVLVKYLF
ncbi:hypothetical protein HUJ04_002839 [Dendroctonus ponderosae]|nr:hypothetical protein HUJ04_002839 [Dendroctonus ponderosae]KAH1024177.1 hypothetical protein HUJ05_003711 [Dendroctonus ponderosae]